MKNENKIQVIRKFEVDQYKIDGKTLGEIINYLENLRQENKVPENARLNISQPWEYTIEISFSWKELETDEEFIIRQEKEKSIYSEENYQKELNRLNEKYGK